MQQLTAGQSFQALRESPGIRSLPTLQMVPQVPSSAVTSTPLDVIQTDSTSPGKTYKI